MKIYTYTREEIKAMTAEETKKAIAEIESNADYFSAYMADRLQGEEQKEYAKNNFTLACLRNHLYVDLNPKYWEMQIRESEKIIAVWEEQIADPMTTFHPANYPYERIAEHQRRIEEYKAELEKLTK